MSLIEQRAFAFLLRELANAIESAPEVGDHQSFFFREVEEHGRSFLAAQSGGCVVQIAEVSQLKYARVPTILPVLESLGEAVKITENQKKKDLADSVLNVSKRALEELTSTFGQEKEK